MWGAMTSPSPTSRRRRMPLRDLPPEVLVLSAVAFSVALGFGIVAPAIPLFAKHFGVSNAEASAVVSAFALMRLITAPFAGRLVDRLGERVIMATGIGIVGVSSLMAGFSGNFGQLVLLRGAGGVGSAMFSVSATSLLLRVVSPDQRGRGAGAFQAGFLLGGVTGPAFGGKLASWSLRAPFFIYAATLLLAGTVATVYLAQSKLNQREAAAGTDHAPTPFWTAVRNPAYRAALVNNFATGWAVIGVRASLVPLLVSEVLHLTPTWTGYGIFVSSATQAALLGPVSRRVDGRGRRPILRLGAALGVVGSVLLAFTHGLPVFLLAMAVFGAATAMLSTSASAVVGDVIGGRGGTAVAGFQMSNDAGVVVGPSLAGKLSDSYSFEVAFLASAGVSAIALVASFAMPETRRQTAASDAAAAEAA
jgi:MFS transporter, DHA1 family, multidrug resistance protein